MSDLNDNLTNGENQQTEAGVSTVEPDNTQPAEIEQPSFAETELVTGVEPVRKKPVLLIVAIIVLVLAAGAAAAYNFIPFVKNNVKMLISKPEKYYAWVEEENLKKTADSISDAYGKVLDSIGKQNESEFELKADIDPENVRALIEDISGSSLSDSGITLPSSISLKTGAKVDGGNTSSSWQINADDNLLASVNGYVQDNKYYVQIPELSSAYLSMDFKTMMDEAMAKAGGSTNEAINSFMKGYTDTVLSLSTDPEAIKEMLSEKELNELIVKYFTIVFENVEDVELKKGVSCDVNGEKVKYNKLAANVDQGSLYNICKAVLKEAKKDNTIIKIIEKFGLSKDDFVSAVDGLLEMLGTVEVSGGETMFTMNVYTNSSGKICGRDIELPDDEDKTISFMTAEKGSDDLIEINILSDGEGVKITGKSTEKSGKESGDIKCELIGTTNGDIEIPISYKDYEIVNEDKGYCKGSFTIDLSSSIGSMITFDLDSDGKGQTIKTDINVNDTKYGTITVSTSEKNSIEIPAFDSSQKVYQINSDGTDVQQYLADAKDTLPEFINNIGSAFGVQGIGNLLGAALSGSSMEDDANSLTNNDDFALEDDGMLNTAATEDVKYDLSKVTVQVSGQTIPLPAKINGILDLVKVEDNQIEANGFASYYSEDYSFGVNIKNDAAAAAAPADCTVTGIHVSEGSSIPASVDGFTVGSSISEAAAKYGATLSDTSSGFITVVDTKSDWNSMTFYYYNGKIDSISITYYEY